MAEVGQKRTPRMNKGPKPLDPDDNVVLDASEGVIDADKLVGSNSSGVIASSSVSSSVDSGSSSGHTEGFTEINKRAKIPEPPSKVMRDEQSTYAYMKSLLPEHWAQIIWYLYRLDPVIIRPDGEEYIDKGHYAITEDYLLKTFGSGQYQLRFNDVGKPKNAKNIFVGYFNIKDVDYPPMINMAELDVNHKSNRGFVDNCIAKGLLTVDKKPMNQQQNNNTGGMNSDAVITLLGKVIDKLDNKNNNNSNQKDPTQDALTAVVTMMKEGNTASTKMLLDQMKENSPNTFIGMISALKELMPKEQPQKDGDGQMFKFLELMNKKDETIMGLMKEMIAATKPKASEVSGEDPFDKMLDRYMKMQELMGGNDRGGGKKSTLEVGLQYGLPVLEKLAGVVQNLLALRAQGNPGNNNPVTVSKSDPVKLEPEAAEIAAAAGIPDGTSAAIVNNNGTEEERMIGQKLAIKQGVMQIGPQLIEAMNRGTSGDAFAESINGFLGPQVYDVIAGLGEDTLVEYLKENTQIWASLGPREVALRIFIKEFIAFGLPADDDEDEPEKEGADATKKEGEN